MNEFVQAASLLAEAVAPFKAGYQPPVMLKKEAPREINFSLTEAGKIRSDCLKSTVAAIK